jgi:hypothetical protein
MEITLQRYAEEGPPHWPVPTIETRYYGEDFDMIKATAKAARLANEAKWEKAEDLADVDWLINKGWKE